MRHNPWCQSNGTEYEDFLWDRIEQGDLMNADTGQPNEQDEMIAEIECTETRQDGSYTYTD